MIGLTGEEAAEQTKSEPIDSYLYWPTKLTESTNTRTESRAKFADKANLTVIKPETGQMGIDELGDNELQMIGYLNLNGPNLHTSDSWRRRRNRRRQPGDKQTGSSSESRPKVKRTPKLTAADSGNNLRHVIKLTSALF